MAKGLSLHIGLNSVDPGHYAGWDGALNACEADAEDMAAIAGSRKLTKTVLLTKSATRKRVMDGIKKAASDLKAGDLFLLTYSGHGGQIPDLNNDEPDGMDETWCLYDGQMVDDELNALLGSFARGVRVLVFSDSCHSGSVVREAYYHGTAPARSGAGDEPTVRYRYMPRPIALRTYRQNRKFYDPILKNAKLKEDKARVLASVLLISGCQDNQYSADGAANGLFTGHLLQVWKSGTFKGDYPAFHKAILKRMPPDQTPNYFREGTADPKFEGQSPFTV